MNLMKMDLILVRRDLFGMELIMDLVAFFPVKPMEKNGLLAQKQMR